MLRNRPVRLPNSVRMEKGTLDRILFVGVGPTQAVCPVRSDRITLGILDGGEEIDGRISPCSLARASHTDARGSDDSPLAVPGQRALDAILGRS